MRDIRLTGRARRWLRLALTTVILLGGIRPELAQAHDQGARLELSGERLPAGGTLGVRGVNFDAEEAILVVLQGADHTLQLGAPIADAYGEFEALFVVPETIAPGAYTVHAVQPNHTVVSVALTIAGVLRAADEAAGARRDADEPLLQPLTQPASPAEQALEPAPAAPSPLTSRAAWLLLALAIGLRLALPALLRGRRARPTTK